MSPRQPGDAPPSFALGIARAFAGALLFSLPLLMTMEVWYLGFTMAPLRLALLLLVMAPVLMALDTISGFKESGSRLEDVVDGLVAYGVGIAAAALALGVMGILRAGMAPEELVGKVMLAAVPAGFGAVLANAQLARDAPLEDAVDERYGTELFLMGAGALFFAFNIAPTEEVRLIAAMMTPWHELVLLLLSLFVLHALVYGVGLRGAHESPEGVPAWRTVFRYSVAGYAVALLVSAYMLWSFGQLDTGAAMALSQVLVLGFPASVGAAAARLVI